MVLLFNTSTYLAFLPAVALVAWSLPAKARPAFLLVASYVFYAAWSAPFLLLIGGLTIVNYFIGLWAGRAARKAAPLILALLVDLGALLIFKYLGLLDETARRAAEVFGVQAAPLALQIVLPLGLSFFTFEFIHYQVDIFRGHRPIADPIRFALFPAFFPTQIAGPIKRYQDFDKQVRAQPRFDPVLALEGVELVALGLFKKMVLADTLLPIADAVFAAPRTVGTADAWAGLLAFSFQIYLDFSGYTDIGRGSAQLLGYRVPENFNAPYLARSLREFWRRWHISLSSWLRDYLYIPLGGSRRGTTRTKVNLLLTMSLGGLWHGAAWHFLAWGAGHGIALASERSARRQGAPVERAGGLVAWVLTQLAVLFLWSLFRAPDVGTAAALWQRAVVPTSGTVAVPGAALAILIGAGVLIAEALPPDWTLRSASASAGRLSAIIRPGYVLALGSVCAYWAATTGATHRFIYFQF